MIRLEDGTPQISHSPQPHIHIPVDPMFQIVSTQILLTLNRLNHIFKEENKLRLCPSPDIILFLSLCDGMRSDNANRQIPFGPRVASACQSCSDQQSKSCKHSYFVTACIGATPSISSMLLATSTAATCPSPRVDSDGTAQQMHIWDMPLEH